MDTEEESRNIKSRGWLPMYQEKTPRQKGEIYLSSEDIFMSDSESNKVDNEIFSISEKSEKEKKYNRLKKKENARDKVLSQYDFMKEDESNIYTSTSEKSYSDGMSETARRELDRLDRKEPLKNALLLLASRDYSSFLESDIIKRIFGPAKVLINHCNSGSVTTEELWKYAWQNLLEIEGASSTIKGKCISCELDRDLGYEIYLKERNGSRKFLGRMGRICYGIRFKALLNLMKETKSVAFVLKERNYDSQSKWFNLYVHEPILKALRDIAKASEDMGKYRPNQKMDLSD